MPVIEVLAKRLFERLGREMDKEELDVFFFEYGLELDAIVSEREKKRRETGIDDPNLSSDLLLKIDVPANRYDLLCEEGICRALRVFLGQIEIPQYRLLPPKHKIIVEDSVGDIRPVVVCAILRDIDISNEAVYNNFISLQTKLHHTVCRKRTLASIGTHDLDMIKGPFYYKALAPELINFIPLNRNHSVNGHELMDLLKNDSHLGPYLHIIKDKPKYPVIYDTNNVVLSLPPIINGEHSKITPQTKNIFIEITATDLTKANVALNTVVTMFSEYCKNTFTVEQVSTVYNENVTNYPIFENREVECEVEYINRVIGVELNPDDISKLLHRMGVPSKLSKDKKTVIAQVTPTRTDIFHKCDLVEDVAIAYGFNNIPFRNPITHCYGSQYQINYISDKVRGEVARNGYTELLTFSLLSRDENYTLLNQDPDTSPPCVEISNPATPEFQVARTSLLPGILKTLESNKDCPLPIKVFEVSDIVLLDDTSETGARNRRELCAVYCNSLSQFEVIHSLLDKIMNAFSFTFKGKENEKSYVIKISSNPTFLEGRRGTVIATVNGKSTEIGTIGVLNPKVVLNFNLLFACSVLILDVQYLVDN